MGLIKNKSVINIVFLAFMAGGLLFTVIGTLAFIDTLNFKNSAIKSTALVTKVESYKDSDDDTELRAYIVYTIDGKEYNETINNASGVVAGKKTTIYYDPNKPERVQTKIELYGLLIFPGMGSLFFIVGLVGMINIIKHRRKDKYLRQNGTRMEAKINNISVDSSITVNDSHPFIIYCKLVDMSGNESMIKSDYLWKDPQPIINKLGLTSLPVYVDRNNSKSYHIDTEQIEKYIDEPRLYA